MDGKPYHEVRSSRWWSGNSTLPGAPYIVPFYLMFSLSVGGVWPGFVIDPGNHTMYVDYVKVRRGRQRGGGRHKGVKMEPDKMNVAGSGDSKNVEKIIPSHDK